MWEKCDLGAFDQGMDVGGLSSSETAVPLRVSWAAVSGLENSVEKQQPATILLMRGQRKEAILVQESKQQLLK